MVSRAIKIGDLVRDRTMGLVWKVVDQDDDGTTYIERKGVRSFTAAWNLDPIDDHAEGSAGPRDT